MIKGVIRRLVSGGSQNLHQSSSNEPLLNYQSYLKGSAHSRAILSYLPNPVREQLSGKEEIEFSNRGIARAIPRALNELGYSVDIISWDDTTFTTDRSYDLLIQHGGVNYEKLSPLVKDHGLRLYFSTGTYWKLHNEREKARFKSLYERRKARLPYDRLVIASEERANREAKGIIALGNQTIADTYAKFPNVRTLNLGCFPDPRYKKVAKDLSSGRKKFLFFAGGGNIHKGLDLVLEAFSKLPYELYIMAYIEPGVAKVYDDLLKLPNIHTIGATSMRSQEFYGAIDRCDFVILPSCSEGQPGSVIECMNEGLIPLLTPEVHIDTADYGLIIPSGAIADVIKTIERAAALDKKTLERMSRAARQAVIEKHSPDLFVETFKNHVRELVDAPDAKRSRL